PLGHQTENWNVRGLYRRQVKLSWLFVRGLREEKWKDRQKNKFTTPLAITYRKFEGPFPSIHLHKLSNITNTPKNIIE
ncbi:hypothetical protein J6590_098521, partial [Homalodisca vitripennis]